MNVTPEEVADCRDRDGTAVDERPNYVADALAESEEVGYQQGLPLWENYSEYPRGGALFRPDARDALQGVAAHDLARTPEDVAAELGTDVSTVENAAALHGVSLPEGGDEPEDGDTDTLTLPCGEEWPVKYLADPPESDSRVLSALLARDGLSLGEAAEWLSDELDRRVRDSEVRQHATAAGLLDGNDETETRTERARPELTTTVESHGIGQ